MALSYTSVPYKAVGTANLGSSTFKNPRHKMWGVFIKYQLTSSTSTTDAWKLILQTNEVFEVKMYVNEFLKNPPTLASDGKPNNFVGTDAVIACEILPVDSFVKF